MTKNRLIHFDVMKKNLALLFEKGYEYRTIGCNRSAISAFHDYVYDKPVGLCALISRIFNNRPPQPRYMFVCGCGISN